MKNIKNKVLLILTILGFAGIYFASQWLKDLTPEQVMSELFDMDVPTRYVFIADAVQPKIAVVDLLSNQQVSALDTKVTPELLVINRAYAKLAYALAGERTVYTHNITSHEIDEYTVDFPIERLSFNPHTTDAIVIGRDRLLIIDTADWSKQTLLDGFIDIRSVHFSPLSNQLWLLDAGQQAVYSYDLAGGAVPEKFALSASWQDFSMSALSPNGEYLLFGVLDSADKVHKVVLWHTATAKVVSTQALQAPILQPFIDIGSRYFIAIDAAGNGVKIVGAEMDKPLFFNTVASPTVSALGWIESKLLVGGVGELTLHNMSDMSTAAQLSLPGTMQALFVTADSKTGLFTQSKRASLGVFAFGDGELTEITLELVSTPKHIIMGVGNTLCH